MQDLNFFADYKKSTDSFDEKKIMIIVSSVVGVVIMVTLIINGIRLYSVNKNIKLYNQKLNDPEVVRQVKVAEELNGKKKILSDYQTKLSNISSLVDKNNIYDDNVLNEINGSIPEEILFNKITASGYQMEIQGQSTTKEAVGEFEHNLEQVSYIKNVHLNSITKDEDIQVYAFKLEVVLKEDR